MVQPSIVAEIGEARTRKIGTIRTTRYIRFVRGAQTHLAFLAMKCYVSTGKTAVTYEIFNIHIHRFAHIPFKHPFDLLFIAGLVVDVHRAGSAIGPAHGNQMLYVFRNHAIIRFIDCFASRLRESRGFQANKSPRYGDPGQSLTKLPSRGTFFFAMGHNFSYLAYLIGPFRFRYSYHMLPCSNLQAAWAQAQMISLHTEWEIESGKIKWGYLCLKHLWVTSGQLRASNSGLTGR
jgi:hypothetical protein